MRVNRGTYCTVVVFSQPLFLNHSIGDERCTLADTRRGARRLGPTHRAARRQSSFPRDISSYSPTVRTQAPDPPPSFSAHKLCPPGCSPHRVRHLPVFLVMGSKREQVASFVPSGDLVPREGSTARSRQPPQREASAHGDARKPLLPPPGMAVPRGHHERDRAAKRAPKKRAASPSKKRPDEGAKSALPKPEVLHWSRILCPTHYRLWLGVVFLQIVVVLYFLLGLRASVKGTPFQKWSSSILSVLNPAAPEVHQSALQHSKHAPVPQP
ncbi:hypothetical protein V5799_019802 [Amblyomma americanum]|uniref:Uncharacterized protein n=1 Tax=Amblyomma americanum TaxID=6943 RepID=A0AAQ4EVQ1_AMBAM